MVFSNLVLSFPEISEFRLTMERLVSIRKKTASRESIGLQ
jgi:hypothetical protein